MSKLTEALDVIDKIEKPPTSASQPLNALLNEAAPAAEKAKNSV